MTGGLKNQRKVVQLEFEYNESERALEVYDAVQMPSLEHPRIGHSACYSESLNYLIVSGSWKEESISTVEYLDISIENV